MRSKGEALLEEQEALPETGDWYVLHTRSRQEKSLAADMLAQGVGVYLPLMTQARYYGRRKMNVKLPLFPGYVFLRGSREDAFTADRTKRVCQIIPVTDQQLLDCELRNLYLALQKEAPLEPYAYLKEGMWVEVRSGPFRGVQGVIEKRVKPDRLLLQIDTLGQAMALEIDASLLEPIDEAPAGLN